MLPACPDGQKRGENEKARRERDARKITSMLARGNVLLQSGSFETEQDVDARRDALRDYAF